MCIIVMQPAEKVLSNTRFKRCWSKNPDGGGFAYPDSDGRLIVSKGYMEMKSMLKAYRTANKLNPDVPFIIHFRIATSGLTDAENTHPFVINDELVMAHNGHITGWGNKLISDTHQFVRKVLAGLPMGFHNDPVTTELLRGYINGDKIVMLDAAGQVVIINEKFGEWDGGIWYSNRGFRKPKPYKGKHWKGHGTQSFYPKDSRWVTNFEGKEDDGKWNFEGMSCSLCTMSLMREDDDMCADLGATEPVCMDCLDQVGINELLTAGVVQWYDEFYDSEFYTTDESAATDSQHEPEDMIDITEVVAN